MTTRNPGGPSAGVALRWMGLGFLDVMSATVPVMGVYKDGMKMSSNDLPIVLFDCDGVLADLASAWFDAHNRACRVCREPLTLDKVVRWDTHEFTACGRDIYTYLADPDLWRALRPVAGSQFILSCIQRMHILRPVVVTTITQGPDIRRERIAWLRHHFPMIDPGDIVIAKHKSCVRADTLIDDAVQNLYNFSGSRKIVFDYPYNRDAQTDDPQQRDDFGTFQRVTSWHDLGKLLYRMYGRNDHGAVLDTHAPAR